MSYTVLDVQLRDQIVKLVHHSKHASPESINTLLIKGANPKAIIREDEFTAYDLLRNYNDSGKFNPLIESFDHHLAQDTRPSDSDWEGMHE